MELPVEKQWNFFNKMAHNQYKVYNQYTEKESIMTYNELKALKHRYELFKGYEEYEEQSLIIFASQFKISNII